MSFNRHKVDTLSCVDCFKFKLNLSEARAYCSESLWPGTKIQIRLTPHQDFLSHIKNGKREIKQININHRGIFNHAIRCPEYDNFPCPVNHDPGLKKSNK